MSKACGTCGGYGFARGGVCWTCNGSGQDPVAQATVELDIPAISLWQPWASAVPLGLKAVETRHWATRYRGKLAIHAAKRWQREQRDFAATERALGRLPHRLPLGAIVAVCTLKDCRPTVEVAAEVSAIERLYGNYAPGRFAWMLDDIRPLPEPIPCRGAQGFFRVPASLLGDAIHG